MSEPDRTGAAGFARGPEADPARCPGARRERHSPGPVRAGRVSLRPGVRGRPGFPHKVAGIHAARSQPPAAWQAAGPVVATPGLWSPPEEPGPSSQRVRLPAGLGGSGGPVRGWGLGVRMGLRRVRKPESTSLVLAAEPGHPSPARTRSATERGAMAGRGVPSPRCAELRTLGLWEERWEGRCRGTPGGSGRVTAGQTGRRERPGTRNGRRAWGGADTFLVPSQTHLGASGNSSVPVAPPERHHRRGDTSPGLRGNHGHLKRHISSPRAGGSGCQQGGLPPRPVSWQEGRRLVPPLGPCLCPNRSFQGPPSCCIRAHPQALPDSWKDPTSKQPRSQELGVRTWACRFGGTQFSPEQGRGKAEE